MDSKILIIIALALIPACQGTNLDAENIPITGIIDPATLILDGNMPVILANVSWDLQPFERLMLRERLEDSLIPETVNVEILTVEYSPRGTPIPVVNVWLTRNGHSVNEIVQEVIDNGIY